MANAKIEFSLGSLTFSGEGAEEWVAAQLDKVLEAAPELSKLNVSGSGNGGGGSGSGSGGGNGGGGAPGATNANGNPGEFTDTLASYLRAKNALTKQTERFLATADWLRRRGVQTLTTSAVAKALSDNQQPRLGNPADCLNKNVAKGFCEKSGNGFFITPDGLKSLGYQQ